jgi:preprotein translocase SecE subunit
VARAVRGQPVKPRSPVGPPAGAGERNYFASVVEELRKVVWPTWNELGRMTGVVITTVILMAVIVSAADYGLGLVVKQLYSNASSSSTGTTGSHVVPQTSIASPRATVPTTTAPPTSAGGTTAPVTP